MSDRESMINKAMIILGILAVIGLAAWGYQIQKGLIVTNLRNPFTWGLYIIMWAFYVGLAAGGLVVSSAIYLFGAKKLKPFASIAATTAFLFAAGSMLMVMPDIGRIDRIFNLFLYPNFSSMLVWDVLVLSVYTLLSLIYTYILLMPNIAKQGIKLPVLGVILKRDLSEDEFIKLKEKSERLAKLIAPIGLPFAILIHTVTAWVLATQLSRPWWYGGLLAPTFIAAAIASGPAVVILASLVVYGFNDELKESYSLLAKISAVSAVALLFMYYNDFVVRAWWGNGREFDALSLVIGYYLPIHMIEVIFVLIGLIMLFKLSDNVKGLVGGSLFVIIGILAHRFLLMPPAYNLIPLRIPTIVNGEFVDWPYPIAVGEVRGNLLSPELIFVSYWNYFPSIFEIMITVGLGSLLILILLALIKMVPYRIEE